MIIKKEIYEGIKDIAKIPELDFKSEAKYSVGSKESVLDPLIDDHQVIIVAGAFFGDEGKGKTVDAVAGREDIKAIARVNSGENAGHTVIYNGKEFIFHLVPSGLFVKDTIKYIGPECVMDPISVMGKELRQVIDAGIDYKNKLFVGNVHLVTPYHKLMDLIATPSNGSTLKGMNPVHASKVKKRGLRLNHLFESEEYQRKIIEKDLEDYYGMLKFRDLTEDQIYERCLEANKDMVRIPEYVMNFLKAEDKSDYIIKLFRENVVDNDKFPEMKDVAHELRKILKEGGKVLLEGPQSYWLSNACEKYWSKGTSADTSSSGIAAAAKYDIGKYKTLVISVHKTPASTRVGAGGNPAGYVPQDYYVINDFKTLNDVEGRCDDFETIQKKFFESIQENGIVNTCVYDEDFCICEAMAIASSKKHGEKGATTRKPRVCGFFDCVAQAEVSEIQGPYLSISAVDRGDDYDKVGVVVAYVYYDENNVERFSNGRKYSNLDIIKAGDPMPFETVLDYCHPIVKLIDGWKGNPIAAGKWNGGLPEGVQELVGVIEHFTGSKVISIGNGPERESLIYLHKE